MDAKTALDDLAAIFLDRWEVPGSGHVRRAEPSENPILSFVPRNPNAASFEVEMIKVPGGGLEIAIYVADDARPIEVSLGTKVGEPNRPDFSEALHIMDAIVSGLAYEELGENEESIGVNVFTSLEAMENDGGRKTMFESWGASRRKCG